MKKLVVFLFFEFFALSTGYAHPAWGIVVDKDKNIYFADLGHNGMGSVWKVTNKGELKLLLQDFHAHNVNLDKANNLITAHGETPHTLVRVRPSGIIDTIYETNDLRNFLVVIVLGQS